MFNLGIQELTLIFVIALIFIGPKQLPGLAKSLGKMVRDFKRASNEITDSFQREAKEIDDFQANMKRDIEKEISLIPETSSVATDKTTQSTDSESKPTVDNPTSLPSESSDDKA